MKSVLRIVLSGLAGMVAGVVLALLWHLVALVILTSPYDGFWDDVYAIIIDCSVGATLGALVSLCIYLYCPHDRQLGMIICLVSVLLSVPALVWDVSSFPHHISVNGSALSFSQFTNQVWYLFLWGLPAVGIVTGFLYRRTLLGKVGMGLAIILIAYGFLPFGT